MKKEGQKTNNLVIHPQKSMSYVFNLRYYSKSGWCPFFVALQEIRFFLFLITLNTHFFLFVHWKVIMSEMVWLDEWDFGWEESDRMS